MVKGVFVTLSLFSVTGWSIILHKGRQYQSLLREERRLRGALDGEGGAIPAGAGLLGRHGHEVIAHAVHGGVNVWEAGLAHALREKRMELESGLTLLASIGASSPFIGLFGTVWGIMHALQGLGRQKALSMDVVAGPVAEALVATGIGLLAAIPAVIGYNLLVRRLRRLMTLAEGNLLRLTDRMEEQPPAVERGAARGVIPFPTATGGGA
ncbi:MAG: MotA/TolQ/ExbB proton channel family protein [Magnetococcales bacterium]|nr:MotA/TolQ/ExbB proton channel family protein [Magnetococcales bacterium]